MGAVIRKIAGLALFAALCYAGYFAYVRWWDGTTLENATKKAETYVAAKAEKAKDAVAEKTEAYAGKVVSEAKQSAYDYVKEKISEGIAGVGNGLLNAAGSMIGASSTPLAVPVSVQTITGNTAGLMASPTGSSYATPPQPATLVAKTGTPLLFSINRGTSYRIEWGDGGIEEGSVDAEQVRLVSHAWKSEGDYLIVIAIGAADASQRYTFPVRVYP